jgi:hypothetical protein
VAVLRLQALLGNAMTAVDCLCVFGAVVFAGVAVDWLTRGRHRNEPENLDRWWEQK